MAASIEVEAQVAATFASIPGPAATDAVAYNSRNHQYLLELHEEYGDIFALDVSSMARAATDYGAATKRVVFAREPGTVRSVLQSDHQFAKTWDAEDQGTESVDYVHNLVQPMLGGTVFNQQGEGGAHQGRLTLKPMFSAAKDLAPGFARQIDRALDAWPTEGRFDALAMCHDLIRQALLYAIGGGSASTADAATEETFHEVLDYFVGRYSGATHDATVTAEDEVMMAKAKDAGMRIVQAWREEGSPETEDKTMLAVMAKAGNSDEEMAAMLVNAIIAGAEAPGSTLAQLLQELAFNPPLLAALQSETDAIAPAGTDVYAVNDKLKYVEATVFEALRFFAPATLVQRVAIEDTVLDGYEIPAGTVVGLCVTAIHRDEKTYANPWSFDPVGRGKLNVYLLKKENCFMTFSGGPRGCPGKHLGIMMMRLALGKIVQRFEVSASWRRAGDHLNDTHLEARGLPKFVEWWADGIPLEIATRGAAKPKAKM